MCTFGKDTRPDCVVLAAFSTMPTEALIVDRDCQIVAANASAAAHFNDVIDLTGKNLIDIFDRSPPSLIHDLVDAASGSTLVLRRMPSDTNQPDRTPFIVRPLPNQAGRVEYFLLIHDVDRKLARGFKQLSDELRSATHEAAEERKRRQKLEANYQQLESFSRTAAHDLKAPLLNISSVLDFIEEDFGHTLPKEGLEYIGMARDAADRLRTVITDLLDHAKSSSTTLQLRPVEVERTLAEVRKSLSQSLKQSGGIIEQVGELGTVTADPLLFHQLIENLISNSLKYRSPSRPPVIRIKSILKEPEKRVEFLELSDNGLGFDHTQSHKLFLPFQRLHIDSGIEGTGLGLATCKAICTRHGWDIQAEGKPDSGATFRIFSTA